jgi:hypothetical protein
MDGLDIDVALWQSGGHNADNGGQNMRRRTVLSAFAVGAAATLAGRADAAFAAESLTADDEKTIHSIVLSYFQRRANTITEAGRRISVADWRGSSTAALARHLDDEMPSLFAGHSLATKAHGGYSKAETSVEITFRSVTADEALVDVVEYTTLYFAGRHPVGEPASRYRLVHSVRLIRAAPNRWVLSELAVVSDGALPPLTQPHLDRAGRKRDTALPALSQALGIPSTTDPEAAHRRPPTTFASQYDHDAMIRYAAIWALGRNSVFPDYHNAGGDCTNFLSQIMLNGGWATVGPPGRATRSKWFYGPTLDDCSYTWGAANNFHSFARTYAQRLKVVANVYYCQDSDVVQYDWEGNDSMDHTQFVSNNYYDEQIVELYMTQHDNDYYLRPITEILADVRRSYPNFKTYGMSHTVW